MPVEPQDERTVIIGEKEFKPSIQGPVMKIVMMDMEMGMNTQMKCHHMIKNMTMTKDIKTKILV